MHRLKSLYCVWIMTQVPVISHMALPLSKWSSSLSHPPLFAEQLEPASISHNLRTLDPLTTWIFPFTNSHMREKGEKLPNVITPSSVVACVFWIFPTPSLQKPLRTQKEAKGSLWGFSCLCCCKIIPHYLYCRVVLFFHLLLSSSVQNLLSYSQSGTRLGLRTPETTGKGKTKGVSKQEGSPWLEWETGFMHQYICVPESLNVGM